VNDPDGDRQIGFIAQDVIGVLPEVVTGSDEDGYGIAYGNLTALLVNAVKEMDMNIKEGVVHERFSRIESLLGISSDIATVSTSIIEGDVHTPFWTIDEYSGAILAMNGINMNGNAMYNIAEIVGIDDSWSVNGQGLLTVNGLVVKGTIEVGSPEKPSGITLYDEVTGEPYCLRMVAGVMQSSLGTCEDLMMSSGGDAGVGDTVPPTITLRGNNPARIDIGDEYGDLGATATDDTDEYPTLETYFEGEKVETVRISAVEDATYEIEYVAYDDAGNTTTVIRTVIVGNGGQGAVTPIGDGEDGILEPEPIIEPEPIVDLEPEPDASDTPEPDPVAEEGVSLDSGGEESVPME
jgi:hypothetical protein